MLTPQEVALESKAERIARIITREYGIDVRIEGTRAYIDLEDRCIYLPDLTKEESEDLADVLDGFLDHESAHAIFTDVEAASNSDLRQNESKHSVWNWIEDYWIEREMGELYIGSGQNIGRLNAVLTTATKAQWEEIDAFNKLLTVMSWVWSGRAQLAEYLSDPEIGSLLSLLSDEIDDGFKVGSTQEAIDLAERILAKIEDLAEQAPQPKPEPQEEESDCDKGDESDSSSGDSEGNDKPTSGEDAGEEENGDTESNEKPTGGSREPAGDGEEDGSDDSTADASSGESDSDSGDQEDTTKGLEQAVNIQDAIDSGDVQGRLDAEEFVNRSLTDIRDRSKAGDPEEYLVFSEAYDTEVTYSAQTRQAYSVEYNKLKAEIQDYLGNMTNALSLSLSAEKEARWVGGSRRGKKWDQRKLMQWYEGSDDDRIHKSLVQEELWDTAVMLLWDCSGSMDRNTVRDGKSYLARLAAIAFHEALKRAYIMHAIYGFNTGGPVPDELRARVSAAMNSGQDLSRFARVDETDKRMVFVPFGSTDGRAICAINGQAANRDGECVLWAAKALAARPERRKVLIVGSDGQPNGTDFHYTEKKYLQTVVRQVISSGIEVLALGIMNPSVKHYYPDYALINQAADIPTVVMGELSHKLFNKGTQHGKFPEFCRRPRGGGSS